MTRIEKVVLLWEEEELDEKPPGWADRPSYQGPGSQLSLNVTGYVQPHAEIGFGSAKEL